MDEFFADMSMLDADTWRDRPDDALPEETREPAPWVDRPGPDESPYYVDTGAHSKNREEWLSARRTGIGGSEIAAVLGESRWGDAGTVYASKVALSPDDESHEWLEWGLRHEPTIAAAYASPRYANRPDTTPDGRLLRSKLYPWALSTLDYQTRIDADLCPLELKTDRFGDGWENGIPRPYFLQVQHQMLVTGAQVASIACLIQGCQLVWCDVPRDEPTIRQIIHAGATFWRCVEAREMPPTNDHTALASVFGRERKRSEVELIGFDWLELDARLCHERAVAKTAHAEADRLAAKIKRAMGRHELARLQDGTTYRWKTNRNGRRDLRRKEAVM